MSNNKQQTAVEWFIEQLEEKGDLRETPSIRNIQLNIDTSDYMELKVQAKEMEKQMTIKLYADYENYLEEAFKNQCGGQAVILSFQEFYEQTYGGNK